MVGYRRLRVPGGTYFFTLALRNRRTAWLTENVDLLREAVREVKHQRPFRIDAMVVLPDHLHALWTLPAGDADYANRWRLIKGGFTRRLQATGVRLTADQRGEYGVWGRRFWEHGIRDQEDFCRHVDYIHYNPVKHGHTRKPLDWPYSSFHRYVEQGLLPADWGTSTIEFPSNIGNE